jgi:magnesium transporter
MKKIRLISKLSKSIGLPPGTLVHIGEEKDEEVKMSIINYDKKHFEEKKIDKIEECFSFRDKLAVTWINIDGIQQLDIIEKIGEHFAVHPLILEDIVNTDQRPKMEDFGDYIFVVLKMNYYDEKKNEIQTEQLSLLIMQNFLISFQEREGDVFNPVRERIRDNKGRIREMGVDYLAHALIDSIVDNYFLVLERIGENLENIEEKLLIEAKAETLQLIHSIRREIILLRRSVWPLRELINNLEKGESRLIQESTQMYFRDIYDHIIEVMDAIEMSRDISSEMLDIYLSSVNNRMNEVMKVLTIIATIFIPLTFLTGIYGMNFENMPGLGRPCGFFVILIVMVAIGALMLVYFKRKKWL